MFIFVEATSNKNIIRDETRKITRCRYSWPRLFNGFFLCLKTNDMELLVSNDKSATVSTKALAEVSDKRHGDVLRDLRNIESNLLNADLRSLWNIDSYKDSSGRKNIMYNLTKKGYFLIITKYDDQLRLNLIERWINLEDEESNRMKQNLELHQTLSERAWDRLDRQDLYKTGL